MVARPSPGLVHGSRPLDGSHDVLPVEQPLGAVDHLADVVETRAVREHLPHRDALLAGLREFRPIGRDGRVVIEQPAVDHDVHGGRRDAFRRREAGRHRVGVPGIAGLVAPPAPGVDHASTAMVDAHRRAALVGFELALQREHDRHEVRMSRSGHGHGTPRASRTGEPAVNRACPEPQIARLPEGRRYSHRTPEASPANLRDLVMVQRDAAFGRVRRPRRACPIRARGWPRRCPRPGSWPRPLRAHSHCGLRG